MFARLASVTVLLALLAWLLMRDREAGGENSGAGASIEIDRPETSPASDEIENTLPGKSVARPPKPTVTLDETFELLGTPIPSVSYPEQTLAERAQAINLQLENAGIPPGQLRLKIHPNLAKQAESSTWKFERLELRSPRVAEILKYSCGSTKICYRVRPGMVEFTLATEPDPNAAEPEPLLPGEEDPFGTTPTLPME